MGTFVHSRHGNWILAGFFFVEAIFFFPADPLLILFCVERRKKAFYYGTIATLASVLGGIAGYYIGYSVWNLIGKTLVNIFATQAKFEYLCGQYRLYQNWAVLVAGFTPLPYKLVTLTAGFCKLPLVPFIACSFIARGARFYLVSSVIYIWGETIKEYIDRFFNALVFIFIAMVAGSLIFLK
jgi:membrane protein YqaA with SNARE-associated domain